MTTIDKMTWAQAGLVTAPGRYMFKFGWLTITVDDLAIWQSYPNAAFALIKTNAPSPAEAGPNSASEEFRLGTFELRTNSNYADGER